MNRQQKILTYLVGFVLGCLILFAIPRQDRDKPKEHPWHAQTAPDGYYPIEITDDYGRTVRLERQPRHFISLAPSITEILFAMDMGDHLMAVTQWCTWPEEAKALRDAGAHVGSIDQPNRETIAAYRPDLIIGTELTPPEIFGAIENPPRTVAMALRHQSMEDILEDVKQIGMVTGVPGKALRPHQPTQGGTR
jgi:iron complex transport system substrate-binding protein